MTDTDVDPFSTNEEDNVNPMDYVKTKFAKNENEIDWEAVAKGKYESDRHITKLESEMAELRTKASQGMAMKDLLEAIKSNRPNDEGNPPPARKEESDPAAKNEQVPNIDELVQEAIRKQEQERSASTNHATVVAKLNEVWGANASVELRKAANALGISVQDLNEMGKRSPNALFKMLGVDTPNRPPSGTSVPPNTVNLGSNNKPGVRNWRYYNELRKSNPKQYADPKTQAQEMRDAIEQGAAFYD